MFMFSQYFMPLSKLSSNFVFVSVCVVVLFLFLLFVFFFLLVVFCNIQH